MLLDNIKEKVRLSIFWPLIRSCKAHRLHVDYNKRRERYYKLANNRSKKLRPRMISRNFASEPKKIGNIHTFAIVRRKSWESNLIDELNPLGKVTVFDFYERGFDESIQTTDSSWIQKRQQENKAIIDVLQKTHKSEPVDWIFCYFDGKFILRSTIGFIRDNLKIPAVNMCLDDKHSWDGRKLGKQMSGQVDLADVFDISWTSAPIAVDWYDAEGGNGLYLPPGFNPTQFYPMDCQFDIPVSFVGACYGARPLLIKFLKKHGIDVRVYGSGWGKYGNGYAESLCEIFNRSQINLGCGYIGHSRRLTNVKGRDFDITGTGGGAYLTTFNSDLAQHFQIGKEILCYHSFDECLELIRCYLKKPKLCRALAKRARERALKEHRWLHRYINICRLLNILDVSESSSEQAAKTTLLSVGR
jgi:spore maturation protein CgeB